MNVKCNIVVNKLKEYVNKCQMLLLISSCSFLDDTSTACICLYLDFKPSFLQLWSAAVHQVVHGGPQAVSEEKSTAEIVSDTE
jgi:hypothetical protein